MVEHRLARQRQAQSETVLLARSYEGLEELSTDLRRDSGAIIGHVYANPFSGRRRRYPDLPRGRQRLDRVRDEVDQHALDARSFAGDGEAVVRIPVNGYALFASLGGLRF